MQTLQHQISQSPGEGECGDGFVVDKDGKSPSKTVSKEKSSQKQIDLEGRSPVKGKKTKGKTKGKGMIWLMVNFEHLRKMQDIDPSSCMWI